MISVVIPTLNASEHLARTLAPLISGVAEGVVKEAVIVDGGSSDETLAIADAAGCEVLRASGPRAELLRLGAKAARGAWFLFLHPGVVLAPGWLKDAQAFMARPSAQSRAAAFAFALDDDAPQSKRAAALLRLRGDVLKLPFGEQGLLISRRLYDMLDGYAALPAMEDADFARRIGASRLTLLRSEALIHPDLFPPERRRAEASRLVRYLLGADPAELKG